MGAGGLPSGGVTKRYGRIGDLPRFGVKPNSRIDLYNFEGIRIQCRWYDAYGNAIRNRDFAHSNPKGNHTFPHDHNWKLENGEPHRIPKNLEPDYEHFNSSEED